MCNNYLIFVIVAWNHNALYNLYLIPRWPSWYMIGLIGIEQY